MSGNLTARLMTQRAAVRRACEKERARILERGGSEADADAAVVEMLDDLGAPTPRVEPTPSPTPTGQGGAAGGGQDASTPKPAGEPGGAGSVWDDWQKSPLHQL